MDYFNLLDKTEVNGVEMVNIANLTVFKSDIESMTSKYNIKEGATVYDISYDLYGSDEYYWTLLLVNPTMIFNGIASTEDLSAKIDKELNVTAIVLNSPVTVPEVESFFFVDNATNEMYNAHYDAERSILYADVLIQSNDISCNVKTFSDTIVPLTGTIKVKKDVVAQYMFLGNWYNSVPGAFLVENAEETKTFGDVTFEENEELREINVLSKSALPNLIKSIREYNGL